MTYMDGNVKGGWNMVRATENYVNIYSYRMWTTVSLTTLVPLTGRGISDYLIFHDSVKMLICLVNLTTAPSCIAFVYHGYG